MENEDNGWESFLKGTVSLSEIKTPINLKTEIKLPQGIWEDALERLIQCCLKTCLKVLYLRRLKM